MEDLLRCRKSARKHLWWNSFFQLFLILETFTVFSECSGKNQYHYSIALLTREFSNFPGLIKAKPSSGSLVLYCSYRYELGTNGANSNTFQDFLEPVLFFVDKSLKFQNVTAVISKN